MYTQVAKPKGNRSKAVANSVTRNKTNMRQGFIFTDNRSDTVVQRKQQDRNQSVVQTQGNKTNNKLQSSITTALPIQRFPWGKSIGGPGLSIGLGFLGNLLVPGIGGYIGAGTGFLLGELAGHWFDTLPTEPEGPAPIKPANMTNTHVPYPEDIDDHADLLGTGATYNQLSDFEQNFLGLNTQENQLTSSLHPATLNDLGMRLSALTGQADNSRGQTKMSANGRAFDAYTYEKLVYDGASAGASRTHQNHPYATELLGESHHLPDQRQQLFADLQNDAAKDTLYLELNQEIQPLVDHYREQYAQDNETPMPPLLRGYLRRLDTNFRARNDQYPGIGQVGTYEHLVDEYVKANKRVVFADSPYAKGIPHDDNFEYNREAAMNQALYEQIVADQNINPSSYAVLTGQAHVGNNRHGLHRIIGLEDRLGI